MAAVSPEFERLLELQLEMSRESMEGLRRRAVSVLRGWAAVALLTAICYRLHANEAVAGFSYLTVVLLNCLDSGMAEAALVSAAAVSCLDYFFIEPRFSMTVTDPVDAAALVALATASLVTTHLASKARLEQRTAERERRNLERLYNLAQRLLALDPHHSDRNQVAAAACTALDLTAVSLFDAAAARSYTAGLSKLRLESRTRDGYIAARDSDDAGGLAAVRCLRSGGKTFGAIGFEGLAHTTEMAGPASAMIAATLLRHEAARNAADAEAATRTETLRSAILDALAHEFKTPLATILTAAGGLRAAAPLDPAQEDLAELVETETERLSELSSRLLRLARLDQEEVRPSLEPVDLEAAVSEAIDRQLRQTPERRFSLDAHPAIGEIAADAGLLQLALGQLLDNACRYSPPGSPVHVRVESSAGWTHVLVWNSGEPIEASERERIFERLYRGRGGRRLSSGTGLGLYVARKIALAHGGRLELAAARPGDDGVGFRLSLPVWKGAEPSEQAKSQSLNCG
jgi:two-component system, OmpR family, sensor histidine kinase KdpD